MAGVTDPTGDCPQKEQILYLPCPDLHDHPLRMDYYLQTHLAELTKSIAAAGLMEPLLVTPKAEAYTILSGHYRIRTLRRLKQKQALCRVIACDERQSAVIYCSSNRLTRQLSAMEEAYTFLHMTEEQNFTLSEIGKLWNRSKSWVCRRLSLVTRLDTKLKKEMEQGFLQPRLAQELARLPQGNDQAKLLKLIRREHLCKDAAAELISCWLNATAAERKLLETEGFSRAKYFGPEHLAKHTSKQLTDCTTCLSNLTSLVRGQKELSWWPSGPYQSCQTAFRELAAALSEGGHDETELRRTPTEKSIQNAAHQPYQRPGPGSTLQDH